MGQWFIIGERGNSVYARGLQVMEGKGRMGSPKHSSEKGDQGSVRLSVSTTFRDETR